MLKRVWESFTTFLEDFLIYFGIFITIAGIPFTLILTYYYLFQSKFDHVAATLVIVLVLIYLNSKYTNRGK